MSDRLRAVQRDADNGLKPLDQRLSVEMYLRDWLEADVRPNTKPATRRTYERIVTLYLVPEVGHIPLAKLAPEHVQSMLSGIAARGRRKPLSASTVRYCHTVLRTALHRAVRYGSVHRNVAALVDSPQAPKRELQPLSAMEARALLAASQGHELSPLFLTALGTGMRQGELLGLRWQDVDLDARTIAVRHTLQEGPKTLGTPKTKQSRRVVTLPRSVVGELRDHRRRQLKKRLQAGAHWSDGDFVFAGSDGRPRSASVVRKAFRQALRDAGLPAQPFHHLRHAYATLQIEAGEELANVSKMLGHASLSTTADLYAHLTPRTQRRAAERMDRILAG